MHLLVNIDVPNLQQGIDFYTSAFGLGVSRRLERFAELSGLQSPIYLLQHDPGTSGVSGASRTYSRHWCPIHLDFAVADIRSALDTAIKAGAVPESAIRRETWGEIVTIADPFGHGICLIQFSGQGYDELMENTA